MRQVIVADLTPLESMRARTATRRGGQVTLKMISRTPAATISYLCAIRTPLVMTTNPPRRPSGMLRLPSRRRKVPLAARPTPGKPAGSRV